MISRLVAKASLAAGLALCGPGLAHAAPADSPPAGAEEEARRHFHTGVKLYQDGNYAGALAEFEAAYAMRPGAKSLQNVALCLKALFRYAEAADRLKLLLERHADELDAADQQAVRDATQELATLVGTVVLEVSPPAARVTLDGQLVTSEQRSGGIRLNVGEHQVVAEAPGYARSDQVLRVAGGQRVTEKVTLKPTAGFVRVETGDPDAAIAIDGTAQAFERYSGPLEPGRHLVQVYREGRAPFQQRLEVAVGETVEVRATTGAVVVDTPPMPEAAPVGRPGAPPQQRGWYALGAATVFNLGALPDGLHLQANDQRAGGFSAGVRAGYRVFTPVGAEALLEGGRHEVPKACLDDPCTQTARYTLDSIRTGGNLRLMSGGEKLRFASSVGSGAVYRQLHLQGRGNAYGVDPYFMLELGAQLNLGHVLLELDIVASFEGTRGTTGNLLGGQSGDATGQVFRQSGGGLHQFGIGIRGGWSEWAPRRAAPLQPAGAR